MKKKNENPVLKNTINELRKVMVEKNRAFWESIIERISSPRSRMASVNVGKISKLTKGNDVILVPGKLLGDGLIGHPVTVGVLSASKSAVKKVSEAGGSVVDLIELAKKYPDGSRVTVMGG